MMVPTEKASLKVLHDAVKNPEYESLNDDFRLVDCIWENTVMRNQTKLFSDLLSEWGSSSYGGGKISGNGRSLLCRYINCAQHIPILKMMLEDGMDCRRVFYKVARCGCDEDGDPIPDPEADYEMKKLLLENGVRPSRDLQLRLDCYLPFAIAADAGFYKTCKLLLEYGIKDIQGAVEAAHKGHTDVCRLILEYGPFEGKESMPWDVAKRRCEEAIASS
jgi:hypothetical protein